MSPLTRRHVLGGLCSCSALALAACNATNAPEGPLSAGYRPLSSSEEAGLWQVMDRAEADIRNSRFRIREDDLDGYVKSVVCKLVPDHCDDVRVYLMRAPYFNATAAPNGMLQVWSGLLLRTENEAQLAAVLGHELGHYLERHSLQQLRDLRDKSSFGAWLTVGLGVGGLGAVGSVASLALLASSFSFSRDQEREADRIGLELMSKAGYRASEVPRIWENLIAEEKADPNARHHDIFFATHPAPEERLAILTQLAKAQGPGGEVFASRYEDHIRGIRSSLLEDELRLRQYGRTLVVLEEIVKAQGEDGELAYYQGEVFRLRGNDGDMALAFAAYERAETLGKYPAELHRSVGLLRLKSGSKEAAEESFARYLRLSPNAPDREMIQSYIKGKVSS